MLTPDEHAALQQTALRLRRSILRMIYRAGGGHITPAFSMVEILTALYFKVMRADPRRPADEHRDRLILSKGHGCAALYAVLAEKGYFDAALLDTFCRPGGVLGGHPDIAAAPGIEATTGALGHGFPFAAGLALAAKLDGKTHRVFTLLGDGECQEGTVWEAALFAAHHQLDGLTAILDYNKLQAMGPIGEINGLEPLAAKWTAFNWSVREVDGHDLPALTAALEAVPLTQGRPSLIIAHTVKGKGLSYMENIPIWHYRLPDPGEMKTALAELGMKEEDL